MDDWDCDADSGLADALESLQTAVATITTSVLTGMGNGTITGTSVAALATDIAQLNSATSANAEAVGRVLGCDECEADDCCCECKPQRVILRPVSDCCC